MTTHAPPCPIVRAFGGATIGFECAECRHVHLVPDDRGTHAVSPLEWARTNAIECCSQWRCDKHGGEFPRGTSCRQCSAEKRAAKEAALYAAAKKVTLAEYDGEYVYRDGYGNEGFLNVGNLDSPDSSDPERDPEWAFGCYQVTVSENDTDLTDHVAEGILGDHHEDAMDHVDLDKVKEASRLVFEACKDVVTYMADKSVVVVFEHVSR